MTLADHDPSTLAAELTAAGFPASHASAILRAFYRGRGEIDFSELRVGPRVQNWVEQRFLQPSIRSAILRRTAASDGTIKLLLGNEPSDAVESVLMPGYRPGRAAACVSSQVGCAMGCDFRQHAAWAFLATSPRAKSSNSLCTCPAKPPQWIAASPRWSSWAWASPCTTCPK